MSPLALLAAAILFTLFGVGAGIITGLIPGIHVNTVASLVIAFQGGIVGLAVLFFSAYDPSETELLVIIACMIVGTLVTHTFLDFIPSVFLGAPDPDTALSVLPGHRLMLKGKGYQAIKCSALGSFGSVIIGMIALLPARLLMGSPVNAYEKLQPFLAWILLIVISILIMGESVTPDKISRPRRFFVEASVVTGAEGVKGPGRGTMEAGTEVTIDGRITALDGDKLFVLDDELLVRTSDNSEFGIGDRVRVEGTARTLVRPLDHMVQRGKALALFFLSGFLGILVLASPLATYNWTPLPSLNLPGTLLFPLFTGLFGTSTLIISIFDEPVMPAQDVEGVEIGLSRKRRLRGILSGTFAGGLVGWFPGVSSAAATLIAKSLSGNEPDEEEDDTNKEFIVSVSGVNTANGIFNVVALFVIMKARSGAMQAVFNIIGSELSPWEPVGSVSWMMAIMLAAVLVSSICALFLTLFFGRLFARVYNRIPYMKLTWSILILLWVLIFVFTGVVGLAVGTVATLIGLIPPMIGVKRVHLMGSLVFPIILFFSGLDAVVLGVLGLV